MITIITALLHPVLFVRYMRIKWYWYRLDNRLAASQRRMNKRWPGMWDDV